MKRHLYSVIFLLSVKTYAATDIQYYRHLVEKNPHNIHMLFNLANTLNHANKSDEALYLYRYILTNHPDETVVQYNCAYTFKKMGNPEKAIPLYDNVLQKQPENKKAHYGYAQAQLMLGNIQKGFTHFEWRHYEKKLLYNNVQRLKKVLQKNPNALRGKRLFIRAEYGSGDIFQFIRYFKILKKSGVHIIMHMYPPLIPLLSHHEYIDEIVPVGDPIPNYDYYMPFMSCAYVCNTTKKTIPCDVPYLKPDPKRETFWRNQLKHDTNFKIGICCEKKDNDITRPPLSRRSIPLRAFKQLTEISGVSVYCLQRLDEVDTHNAPPKVHFFSPFFDRKHGGFSDSAAIMQQLDVVISIDTAIAHLAGALGKKVLVPLPVVPDWRWMFNRTDCPWYPTMRLFRQKKEGDWSPVIQEIIQHVQKMITS